MATETKAGKPLSILTIGHSTRPLEELIDLLKENGVQTVADIRSVPRSRRNPQFNQETLPAALESAGIAYVHMTGLGGLRRPRPDSSNDAWRNPAFRGFADFMQTPDFTAALESLIETAKRSATAIMCAEALHWRCHRSLISDALLARGVNVEHIVGSGKRQAHKLTPFARVDGERVTYPATPLLE